MVPCETCGNNIGAVLMQHDKVVAYRCTPLSPSQKVYKNELLANINTVQLEALPPSFWFHCENESYSHTRNVVWNTYVVQISCPYFTFLVHVGGKMNVVADALSQKNTGRQCQFPTICWGEWFCMDTSSPSWWIASWFIIISQMGFLWCTKKTKGYKAPRT